MLQTRNQFLKKAELGIRAGVAPKLKAGLERTIVAGLSIMYSKGGAKLMKEQLDKDGEPDYVVAQAAVNLVALLIKQSNNTMPVPIATRAAALFALEGLDVVSKIHGVQITNELVAKTQQEAGSMILQHYGVTPEKLQQMTADRRAGKLPGAMPAAPEAPVPAPAAPPRGIVGGAVAQPTEAA